MFSFSFIDRALVVSSLFSRDRLPAHSMNEGEFETLPEGSGNDVHHQGDCRCRRRVVAVIVMKASSSMRSAGGEGRKWRQGGEEGVIVVERGG